MTTNDNTYEVSFIPDDAASADYFGSHEPVATAIAKVIRNEPSLKVIGLMGAWGSGKSTVLNILRTKLTSSGAPTDTRMFVYDAWVHQSDPPRRSFLETLVDFFVKENLTLKSLWQDDLNRLNRRVEEHDTVSTPTLTGSGKFLATSLLLFPIGLSLLSPIWKDSTVAAFGFDTGVRVITLAVALLLAPVIVAAIIFYLWRPNRDPAVTGFFTAANWTKHRHPHEKSTIFSIFVNKAVDRITNRIIRTPDPTAIEFQETYQKVMAAVSTKDRRFVFVIDNLDRIPESEAVTLWSTVRSFFLPGDQLASPQTFPPPIVILPLDPHTVRRMYGNDTVEGGELAQSFLDKTFDLVFRVAPPVVSDWQSYLERKLADAVGAALTDHYKYAIKRLYMAYLQQRGIDEKKTINVTPRTIIKLVNLIATLKLQYGADISLPVIGYYAIHKNRIEEDIGGILNSKDEVIARLEPDWRTLVAAIYFNVPTRKALQLLMQPRLEASIVTNDGSRFNELAKVPGFERVLEQVTEQFLPKVDPVILSNTANLLSQAKIARSPQIAAIEQNLRNRIETSDAWNGMNESAPTGIGTLLLSCPQAEISSFASEVSNSLGRISSDFEKDQINIDNWTQTAEVVRASCSSRGIPLQQVNVPGTPSFFLKVVHVANQHKLLVPLLRPSQPPLELVQLFSANSTATGFQSDAESDFDLLRATGVNWNWESLETAAGSHFEKQAIDNAGSAVALRLLGDLRNIAGLQNELTRLSNAGQLLDKLAKAHAGKLEDAEAVLIALLILVNPRFDMPTTFEQSDAGRQIALNLTASLSDRPNVSGNVDGLLQRFGSFKDIVEAAQVSAPARQFVESLFQNRVREGRIGPLHIDDVTSQLGRYLKLLDDGTRATFMRALPNYETYLDKLKTLPFGDDTNPAFDALITADESAGQSIRDEIIKRAEQFDVLTWEKEITRGGLPLNWILYLIDRDNSITFGEPLEDALRSVFTKSINGTTIERPLIETSFKLIRALNRHTREVLLKDIRDQMISVGSNKIMPVLEAGAGALLTDGQFSAKADEVVRRIVSPLLDAPQGRIWLVSNKSQISEWVAKADTSTRAYIAERLADISKAGEATAANDATELLATWGLKARPDDAETESESGTAK